MACPPSPEAPKGLQGKFSFSNKKINKILSSTTKSKKDDKFSTKREDVTFFSLFVDDFEKFNTKRENAREIHIIDEKIVIIDEIRRNSTFFNVNQANHGYFDEICDFGVSLVKFDKIQGLEKAGKSGDFFKEIPSFFQKKPEATADRFF